MGCEIQLSVPGRPETEVSLLAGTWFDRDVLAPRSVTVRGRTGVFGQEAGGSFLTWDEATVAYGIVARGMSEAEVLALAESLQPVVP